MTVRGRTIGYTIIGSLILAYLLLAAKGFWLYLVEGKTNLAHTDPWAGLAAIGLVSLVGMAVFSMFVSFLKHLIEEDPTVQIGKNKRK